MPPCVFIRLGMHLLYPAHSGWHNSAQADLYIGQILIPSQPISEWKTVLPPIVQRPVIAVIKGA